MDSKLIKILELLAETFGIELTYKGDQIIITQDVNRNLPKDEVKFIIEYLNKRTGKAFKASSQANKKLIQARLKENTCEEITKVIDVKTKEWLGTKFEKYLQPSTLFRASNFENYLNQDKGRNPLLDFFQEDWA